MPEKKIIPIIFATDDGYAPYLGVALHSLIVHASTELEYLVHILYTKLAAEHRRRLCNMAQSHVRVECVDIREKTDIFKTYSTSKHFKVESTYRLLIPELFSQFDKILYLDCDIIVREDVALLYQTDLGENVLGVGEVVMGPEFKLHFQTVLGVEEEEGFNSGVLLVNTKQFQREGIKEKCLNLLLEDWESVEKKYIYPDQDVLNITCTGKTKKFPISWNFEWLYSLEGEDIDTSLYELSQSSLKIYEENVEDPKIIHYISPIKPWNRPDLPFADIFWRFARETVFYEEILKNVMVTTVKKAPNPATFPWKEVPAGSVIVIYGGGYLGRNHLELMVKTNYCFVAAICDQNAKRIKDFLLPVVRKEELSSLSFDYIIISLMDSDVKEAVKRDLIELGIAPEKIK
ncbi:MAG: glycosyltransferase family 8 protein [Eubacteriales bacterium]